MDELPLAGLNADTPDTGQEQVALDFADSRTSDEVLKLLTFAEIPTCQDPRNASLIVGDRKRYAGLRPYVVMDRKATQVSSSRHVWISPWSRSGLLSVMARARGQAPDEYPSAALDFVGTSENAHAVRRAISSAATSDITVLVTGESGTGKEIVARSLHAASARESGPFVPVNCGAIPNELLESELFGHEKGAFTGAITKKTGRFELADGGTLFLDEIGDLPFAMQVKLLRAIEDKSFERVGGIKSLVSDVRIVAATNIDLEKKIRDGEFREDLYYRLNVYPIDLAPLRARSEDIPLLVNILTERLQRDEGLTVQLSVDALETLRRYNWPGNVRELGNLLNRLAVQQPNGLVHVLDLPRKFSGEHSAGGGSGAREDLSPGEVSLPVNGIDLKDYLTRLEKRLIEQALQDTNSVVARAADRLHIRRTTLVEKMRKHGLGRGLNSAE